MLSGLRTMLLRVGIRLTSSVLFVGRHQTVSSTACGSALSAWWSSCELNWPLPRQSRTSR
eukprot:1352762-Pyramimonas_sp.AAC.1